MKRVIYLAAALIFPLLTYAQGNKYEYTPKVKNRVEIVNVLVKSPCRMPVEMPLLLNRILMQISPNVPKDLSCLVLKRIIQILESA